MSEQLMSPDVASVNSYLPILSSCFGWLLMFGKIRIHCIGFCINLIKQEYAAYVSKQAVLQNTRNYVIDWLFFSFMYFRR